MSKKVNCRLSIIVPVYNVERHIERCMKALLQLDCEEAEILCIDDGSTDSSGEICEKFALRDARVRVVHHQVNKGPSLARSTGLSLAEGEYLSFVDSDDRTDSRLFKSFIEFLDGNPDVDLCIGGVVREYPDGSEVPMFEESPPRLLHREEALREMVAGRIFFWFMCGKVYRRTVFEGFCADETVTTSEDLDALWRLFSAGKIRKVWYSPEYRYYYYYNTCGMSGGNRRMERYESDLYVLEKILKSSDREKAGTVDIIRGHAIQSVYSMLRECYFPGNQCERIDGCLRKAAGILDSMDADEKKKSTGAQRLARMVKDRGYADDYFEHAFSSMRKAVSEARRFRSKYIYGTGVISKYVTAMMQETDNFDGYVISDGEPSVQMFEGRPVCHLSELSREGKKAIILAVNRKNQREIMEVLKTDENITVLIPDVPEDF